jgi:hypothetical protein
LPRAAWWITSLLLPGCSMKSTILISGHYGVDSMQVRGICPLNPTPPHRHRGTSGAERHIPRDFPLGRPPGYRFVYSHETPARPGSNNHHQPDWRRHGRIRHGRPLVGARHMEDEKSSRVASTSCADLTRTHSPGRGFQLSVHFFIADRVEEVLCHDRFNR